MRIIDKEIFDKVFVELPFFDALDTCIEISKFNLECQINDRIDLYYWKSIVPLEYRDSFPHKVYFSK